MARSAWFVPAALLALGRVLPAAQPAPIYDEAKVPPYVVPDALRTVDGRPIVEADAWKKHRPELLRRFETYVYGKMPGRHAKTRFVARPAVEALGGKALRKEVRILFSGEERGPAAELLVFLPKTGKPAPIFLGLNFQGNHAVHPDPAIAITSSWMRSGEGADRNRATEKSRGAARSRWPVEMIVGRGYGLATMYYGDIDPDFDDGFRNGVHPLFDSPGPPRPADAWGSIGAWAWGLSRAMDYLATDPAVDARRVAVMGHSRLGKTALWAGATDERFALTISNNSGCGGAALSRRVFGETVGTINRAFPHWFCDRFGEFNENEAKLPVDQHELIALVAPRPVYVASAAEDLWADPRGEFLACKGADPVYRLLGTEGLPVAEMPAVDVAVHGQIGYHNRRGKHDVTDYDWRQYLDFADRRMR